MSDELEEYGDSNISSYDAKFPRWLFWSYFILIFWGIIWFSLYWNGEVGWLDRGYWTDLQNIANTRG
jgi:hypothetical protein